jgi:hypothetical protein
LSRRFPTYAHAIPSSQRRAVERLDENATARKT